MAIDASIYGNIGRGVKSVADYDAEALGLESARTQGETNRLALMLKRQEADQMAASAADQNALRQIYVELGNTPLDQIGTELRKRGRFNEGLRADQDAAKLANDRLTGQKTQADIGKIGAETTGKNVETVGKVTEQFRNQLTMVRNPDDAVRWLKAQYDHPILGPEMERMAGPFMEAASRIPTTPQEFAQYIQSTGMGMEKFIQNQTAIRGQDTTAATAAANRERMAADAAASRAVQMRGQNLSDARARESNSAAMSKPFEVTGPDGQPMLVQQDKQGNIKPVQGFAPKSGAEKPLTEGQAKAVAFASRMQASNRIIQELADKGTNVSVPGSRAGFGIGTAVNAISPAANQQLDQAKRDFVNAVLRRESGAVISDSEFDNADKQYFPQIGDSKAVIKQKADNRRVALEGMKADVPTGRRSQIDEIAKPASPAIQSGADLGGGFRVK